MCVKKILDIEKRVLTDLIKLYPNCSLENLDNNFKELYKRFIIPFYIPVLILIALLIILKSKEDSGHNILKSITYIFGLIIIIFSETTIRFIDDNLLQNVKFSLIPLFLIIITYLFYSYNFIFKIRKY
jgi:lipopolysaccharide export system permease protein